MLSINSAILSFLNSAIVELALLRGELDAIENSKTSNRSLRS
jgi:hypothetical protein